MGNGAESRNHRATISGSVWTASCRAKPPSLFGGSATRVASGGTATGVALIRRSRPNPSEPQRSLGTEGEDTLRVAEQLELPETLAQALNTKSLPLLRRHRWYEARLLLEGALELALAHDLHAAALRAYTNLVAFLWVSGRTRERCHRSKSVSTSSASRSSKGEQTMYASSTAIASRTRCLQTLRPALQ